MERISTQAEVVIDLLMTSRDIANRTGSKVVIDDADKFDQRVVEIAKMLQIEVNKQKE